MATKRFSTFPKLRHHWNITTKLFSVISGHSLGWGEVLPLCRGMVGVFSNPIDSTCYQVLHKHCINNQMEAEIVRVSVEIIFSMMEVCVDGTFFAFTGRSGSVTWPKLTPFFILKQEKGNLALFGKYFGGSWPLKTEFRTWPLRIMWSEEIFLWTGKFLMTESLIEFYQVSYINCWISYSKGDIFICWTEGMQLSFKSNYWISFQKEIFIIAKRRKFYQFFYCGISISN